MVVKSSFVLAKTVKLDESVEVMILVALVGQSDDMTLARTGVKNRA
jgi:hypothetical protein